MLYETFNANKESLGEDFFISRLDDEIVQNLNPKFGLREYQKEALGRFDFYFGGYQKRAHPAQLLFHMATGSGKRWLWPPISYNFTSRAIAISSFL